MRLRNQKFVVGPPVDCPEHLLPSAVPTSPTLPCRGRKLNIVRDTRISVSDELRLDRFEGCPTYYYKRRFALRVRRNNGRKTTELCSAYIMHEDRQLGKPDMVYFRLIDQGYAQYGFDLSVLDEGLAASIGRKESESYIREYLSSETT